MRRLAVLLAAIVTACSQAPEGQAGPSVEVTAAPGVAFAYQYYFRLPAARIAGVQEHHAAACERLGITRCRIAGMRFGRDGNAVNASLQFKLAPPIARAFGRNGIAAIEAAEGMLLTSEITGTDVLTRIDRADAERGNLAKQRTRIDRELARPSLSSAERAELVRQGGVLDEQTRAAANSAAEQRALLASTPMTFIYESGRAISGFDAGLRLSDALDTASASLGATLAALLWLIAVIGPPALIGAILYLLWRRFGRRWFDRVVGTEVT